MRDDQILTLIRKEMAHVDNLSLLRYQQNKLRMDSMMSAICEKRCLLITLFKPEYFYKRVEEIYTVKAQEFNERMKEAMDNQKIKERIII
jgi:hypothetical protein